MIDIMRDLGVPEDAIRPNGRFPLRHGYATSTVDEVALLMEEGLISPELYGPGSPLAIVLHRRHGARALDVFRKVGFDSHQLQLLHPPDTDPYSEVIIRCVYRVLVLGSRRSVPVAVLRYREERLMRVRQRLRITLQHSSGRLRREH